MKNLLKITVIETKLIFRDPVTWTVALLLPTVILLILGSIPDLNRPQEIFGGSRFIDLFVPSLLVVTLATLGVNALPIRLANYRHRGVLRRLSTTPVSPVWLLAVQLGINIILATGSVVLLVLAGNLVFNVPIPANLPGFAAAYLLGMASVFALGLLVAALAPDAQASSGISLPLYFVVMFLGGAYLPRVFLPDFLVALGEYAPPGVQGLLDAWNGAAPQALPLVVLALVTLAAGGIAARFFRWE